MSILRHLTRPLLSNQLNACLVLVLASATGATAHAAYPEAKLAYDKKDFSGAYSACLATAKSGDADCQNAIGVLYMNGQGAQQSKADAKIWLARAADAGHTAAQYNLGLLLSAGQPSLRDTMRAIELMQLAADKGHPGAQASLGNFFAEGRGVPMDASKATKFWRLAAERNHAMAQNNLGWSLMRGVGVEKNLDEAKLWLTRASQQTDDWEARELAQKNLAALPNNSALPNANLQPTLRVSEPTSEGRIDISLDLPAPLRLRTLTLNGQDISVAGVTKFHMLRHVPVGSSELQINAELSNGANFTSKKIVVRPLDGVTPFDTGVGTPRLLQTESNDSVAIIIGAEEYERLPRSDFSFNDAARFYYYASNVLKIPTNKIRLLSGTRAKRSDILLNMKNWLPSEIKSDKTRVFIFYSGHGIASTDAKRFYVLPSDTNLELLDETAIGIDHLLQLAHRDNPKEVVLIIDSCFSGAARGGRSLMAGTRPVLNLQAMPELPARTIVISSATNDQVSLSSPETGHGIFSFHLMSGLNGDADTNNDRMITTEELFTYVSDRVVRDSRRLGREQQPLLNGASNHILLSASAR